MHNTKKYMSMNSENTTGSNLRSMVNGKYEETMDKDDLEIMRFMIGGICAK